MKKIISITSIQSISPLGHSSNTIWENYQNDRHYIIQKHGSLIAQLPQESKEAIKLLKTSDSNYKNLDYSVLYAMHTARKAVKQSNWNKNDNFGINIGSSRGATQLFENYYQDFLKSSKAKPLSSPTTTLGNISSWVAHDLQTQGPELSHSITCSTALHAMLNGIAWIQSGMCQKFLVGGSESPLTPFTIAQMKALKIYAQEMNDYPCRPLDINKSKNTMVLGEGAAMACLEEGVKENAIAHIVGVGYATEILEHNASISTDAICFQRSMNMALKTIDPSEIDVVITHSPGTLKGDFSEYNAIKNVFGNSIPFLTNNKWKLGHTLGASGMLSVEMALLMLSNEQFISIPFLKQSIPNRIKTIMVNAVGFGGNAVSIILQKP